MMRARDLDHAIALQNGTPFGLTGGIHTLDTAEIERWLANVEVGNAYVNRHITGAIVRRQPFGGWKRSTVGGGAKPGGPGHVAQFTRVLDPTLDADAARRSFARCGSRSRPRRTRSERAGGGVERPALPPAPARRRAPPPRAGGGASRVVEAAAAVLGVELLASTAEDESDREFAARCVAAAVDRVRLLCDGRRRRPARAPPGRHRRRRHAAGRRRRGRTPPLGP